MKNIFKIFAIDIAKIFKHPFAVLVLIGIMILPSLYAWFNIEASWDPYSNTAGLSVAVATNDKGAEFQGVTLNIGDQVIAGLAQNNAIGWDFVDEATARAGIESSKYYAAVILPEDFSQKMTSILSKDVERPEILYLVNEKKNAIAPKITDKAVEAVQQQLNKTFSETATQAVIGAVNNLSTVVEDNVDTAEADVTKRLDEVNGSLDDFGTSIRAVKAALSAVHSTLDATGSLLPQTESTVGSAISTGSNIQGIVNTAKAATQQVTDSVGTLIDSVTGTTQGVADKILKALDEVDPEVQLQLLTDVRTDSGKLLEFNDKIISALTDLNNMLSNPSPLIAAEIARIQTVNDKIVKLNGYLDEGIKNLKEGKQPINDELKQFIRDTMADITNDVNTVESSYTNDITPVLNGLLDSISAEIGSLNGLLASVNSTTPGIKNSIDSLGTALNKTLNALDNVDMLVVSAKGRVSQTKTDLNSLTTDDRFDKLLTIVNDNPDLIAQFMASPVLISTEKYYTVENYGSAMTPFYTILCLWVGAIVISAICKARVKPDRRLVNLKPRQEYFGRYLLYLFIAVIQSLIVCLGDVYMLKTQCADVKLFVLTGVAASVVFSIMVFTLVISFGDVGKAIAVVLLVIQVAGAGGTFPAEVLPAFFRNLQPFMPFVYGINAMREAVAGVYSETYWYNMRMLFILFVPISLFIGLVLRRPFIKVNTWLEEKLEETDVM